MVLMMSAWNTQKKSAKAVYADFEHGEYDEFTDQVIVDTENEWQVWDVVKLPD